MAVKTINVHETQMNDLFHLVLQGTEVIFTQNNTPFARLIPINAPPAQARIAGLHQGAIWISDDFDVPLPDSFWLGTA